jgi:circadian clock protein KaiC
MTIGSGGVSIFPRYTVEGERGEPPPLDTSKRLASGIGGLDELLGGGLLERSVTLVSGSAGIGKSTLALQFILEGAKRKEPGLYIAMEEGPSQIVKAAESLGLPLGKAVADGLVEMLYLSQEHIQASQLLAILLDRIGAGKIRRLALDSASQVLAEERGHDELRDVLLALVAKFKQLGVTTLLTLESKSLFATDVITDHGFSPVADNIVMLRYVHAPGEIRPTLSIVKSRGSAHDRGTYYYAIAKGGIALDGRVEEKAPKR